MTIDDLRALDDRDRPEAPAGFDWEDAVSRFHQLAAELKHIFPDLSYETGPMIQDASFHGQIAIPSNDHFTTIRASNFGRLVAVFDEDDCLSDQSMDALSSVFEKHKYHEVDPAILEADYSGPCAGVSGYRCWRERYFDYT